MGKIGVDDGKENGNYYTRIVYILGLHGEDWDSIAQSAL